jgi:hypothetical protein
MGSTVLSTASLGSTAYSTGQGMKTSGRPAAASSAQGNVGVFIGISYNEYGPMAGAVSGTASTYTATGSSLSVAAGKLLPLVHSRKSCWCHLFGRPTVDSQQSEQPPDPGQPATLRTCSI